MNMHFRDYLGILLSSIFATYTIYEKFMLPELQIPMIVSIIFAAIFAIFFQARNIILKTELCNKLSYAIFSLFMVIGDSFKSHGSLFGIWGNPFKNSNIAEELFEDFSSAFSFLNGSMGNALMLLSSLCKGVGYYFIIRCVFELIKYFWEKSTCLSSKDKGFHTFLDTFFSKNTFRNIFLFLIIAWLPYLLIKLPASVSADAMSQIRQFLANRITTHHPFFTTLLYGGFSVIGLLMGDISIGLCFCTIIQYVFMAAAFAYCITCIDRLGKTHTFSFILVLLFAFSPSVPTYATSIVKDSLYATFFVLYITQMILTVRNIELGRSFCKNLIFLSVISVFLCITRNNGIYIVAPTAAVLSLCMLLRKDKPLTQRFAAAGVLLLPLLFYTGYHFLQYDVLGLEKGSVREALSIPFQQTARYVKEHPEEITPEDAEIIDNVLDYENLGSLYNPVISDPVKATYKEDADALPDYFKVWLKHLKKHPVTYAEATIHTNYFAFYPDEPNIRIYGITGSDNDSYVGKALKLLLTAFTMGISSVPILSCVVNPVFYVWLFIYLLMHFLFHKKRLQLLLMLPLILQLLTVIAGPAVFNHPRYIYPISWSIPFIAAYLAQKNSSDDSVCSNE